MKTNEELRKDVQEAIKWEPLLHRAEIDVTTLIGIISSWCHQDEAGRIVWNTPGIWSVENQLALYVA